MTAKGFAPERIRVQPRAGAEIIIERIPKTVGSQPEYLDSKWIVAVAVLLFIAAGSGLAAYSVIRYRTEAALNTEFVKTALVLWGEAKDAGRKALEAQARAEEERRIAEAGREEAAAALDVAKTRHSEEITDLQSRITKLAREGESLSQRITDRHQRIAALTRERDSLTQTFGQSEQRIAALNREITALLRDKTRLQAELEGATQTNILKRNAKDGLEYGRDLADLTSSTAFNVGAWVS